MVETPQDALRFPQRARRIRPPIPPLCQRVRPPIHPARPRHPRISACVVARNEERLIGRCLASFADLVDEIVFVHDGECEDRTLEIAKEYGCRIFERPLRGHADASKVFAFAQTRHEWILGVDADEFLSEGLARTPARAREQSRRQRLSHAVAVLGRPPATSQVRRRAGTSCCSTGATACMRWATFI